MANLSQRQTHAQQHKFAHKLTPNIRNLQELSFLHGHLIMHRIDHELSQNHALELDPGPDLFEGLKPKERDDDYNPDYAKPIDEFETGDSLSSKATDKIDTFDISENLEQAAKQYFIDHPDRLKHALKCIDHYRVHGFLPEDADPQLQKDLAALENSISYQTSPSIYPTFEVLVEGDRVEASVVPIGLNLKCVRGLGPSSTSAKNFIKLLHDRNKLLNDLAYCILELLQGDFFRQNDFYTALSYLIPVPVDKLNLLIDEIPTTKEGTLFKVKKPPFKIDKKYLSKLGDHLVACRFGSFSLNFFLQDKAQILRLWVNIALKNGIVNKNEQLDWIRGKIEERVEKWDSSDIRQKFILPLKKITIDNVKYAQKMNKKTLNTSEK